MFDRITTIVAVSGLALAAAIVLTNDITRDIATKAAFGLFG